MPDPNATAARADCRVAWHRLLQVSRLVLREIDVRLDEEHRLGVNDFDVLITLDNADGRRLRMSDLAGAVMLSSGGLTRLVDRLESRGLVQRIPDPRDARGFHAVLSEAGAKRLSEARVTHDAVIDELVGAKLTDHQIASLAHALGRVVGR
jgi:DNA-binding MarR family transcriptional regulator